MKKSVIFLLALFVMSGARSLDFDNSFTFKEDKSVFKVKDLFSKLDFNQSYSVAFSSSSWGNQTTGMYLNDMSYQFDKPLEISVVWGFMNPLAGSGEFAAGSPKFVLPRFSVKYKPFKNMIIQFEYRNMPYGSYGTMDPFLGNSLLNTF